MTMMLASSAVLFAIPLLVGFNAPQARRARVEHRVLCPDEIATTGYYRNYSYGFSFSIPRGFKGFWNSARCVKEKQDCVCMGDHGRYIPLDEDSFIQVFVSPQNEETVKDSIDEEVRYRLSAHEKQGEQAIIVRRGRAALGNVAATRLTLKYRQAKTGKTMIEDQVMSPPPLDGHHGGFIFSVTLSSPENQYAKSKALFHSIIRSWRFRSVPW